MVNWNLGEFDIVRKRKQRKEVEGGIVLEMEMMRHEGSGLS